MCKGICQETLVCKGMPSRPSMKGYAKYTSCARVCQLYQVWKGMPRIPSIQGFYKYT